MEHAEPFYGERNSAEQMPPEETLTGGTSESYARIFGFVRNRDADVRPIAVKQIGSFEGLLASAESHRDDHTERQRAEDIITTFRDARVTFTLPSGKEVTRRPHLLITGGFVRDTLLEKPAKDIDFATNLTSEEVSALLERTFVEEMADERITIKRTGESFPVLRVAFRDSGEEYEIATFRKERGSADGRHPEHIEPVRYAGEDADRRDFTVNSLFYNPFSGNVIDYVGGLRDLEEGRLRFVGDPHERIAEDHLRMLRYIRFLEKTGLAEDEQAKSAIRERAGDILRLKPERITEELNAAFKLGSVGASLERLREYGLLEKLLPEVSALALCEQGPPYHMEGDVFRHTVLVADGLPQGASVELAWAAILHDIGKPETRSETHDPDGNAAIHFLEHERASAVTAERIIGERFRFSNESKEKILGLIRDHIPVFSFPDMRPAKAREFATKSYFPELMALAEADMRASQGSDSRINQEHLEGIDRMHERYKEIMDTLAKSGPEIEAIKKLINGNLIQEQYRAIHGVQIPQKQLIGTIKNTVMERIADSQTVNQEAARELLDAVIREFPPQ